jgi:hypothetical protein
VHRVGEVFQRRINGAAFKLVFVRKGNRMNHKVNLAPFFAQFLKAGFDRSGIGYVAFNQRRRERKFFRQRDDPFFQSFVLIGNGDLRTLRIKRLSNAPGNGFVIGEAHNQALFASHKRFSCHSLITSSSSLQYVFRN